MKKHSRGTGFCSAMAILLFVTHFPLRSSADPTCVATPPGLISWWRGEENANDSIGMNNGVLLGNVAFTNGMVGQGFLLNGDGAYIRIPHSPSLNFTSEITIEL